MACKIPVLLIMTSLKESVVVADEVAFQRLFCEHKAKRQDRRFNSDRTRHSDGQSWSQWGMQKVPSQEGQGRYSCHSPKDAPCYCSQADRLSVTRPSLTVNDVQSLPFNAQATSYSGSRTVFAKRNLSRRSSNLFERE